MGKSCVNHVCLFLTLVFFHDCPGARKPQFEKRAAFPSGGPAGPGHRMEGPDANASATMYKTHEDGYARMCTRARDSILSFCRPFCTGLSINSLFFTSARLVILHETISSPIRARSLSTPHFYVRLKLLCFRSATLARRCSEIRAFQNNLSLSFGGCSRFVD